MSARERWRAMRPAVIVLGVLATVAVSAGHSHTLEKFDAHKQLGIRGQLPAVLGDWRDVTPAAAPDRPGIAYNEIHQALYEHPQFGRIALTIEYTSDSRRQFELHYPDVCHRVRGDSVVPYPRWNLPLPGSDSVSAAVMSWQQPNQGYAALAVYWYVTREGITTDTVRLKWDQALSGLLRKPSEAAMVRFDSFYQSGSPALERQARLQAVHDFAGRLEEALEPRLARALFDRLEGA